MFMLIKKRLLVISLIMLMLAMCSCGGNSDSGSHQEKEKRVAENFNAFEICGMKFSVPDYYGENTTPDDNLRATYYAEKGDTIVVLVFSDLELEGKNYSDKDFEDYQEAYFEEAFKEDGISNASSPEVRESSNGLTIASASFLSTADNGSTFDACTSIVFDKSSGNAISVTLAEDRASKYYYYDDYKKMIDSAAVVTSSDKGGSSSLNNADGADKKPSEIFVGGLQQEFDAVADVEKMELVKSGESDNDVDTYDIYVDDHESGIYFSYDNANSICTIGGKLSNEQKFMRVYGLSCACLIKAETGLNVSDAYDVFDSMLQSLEVGAQIDKSVNNHDFSFKEVELDGEHFVLFTDYRLSAYQ